MSSVAKSGGWSMRKSGSQSNRDLCAVQIRAGTGGDEAALFAADLLRMYQRYADAQSWKVAQLSESPGETGGLKEVIVQACTHINRARPLLCLQHHSSAQTGLCTSWLPHSLVTMKGPGLGGTPGQPFGRPLLQPWHAAYSIAC